MQLFFSNHISGTEGILSEEETRHCISVLRKQQGDMIDVVDGKGGRYHAVITKAGKHSCEFSIVEHFTLPPFNALKIHLVIAPTKNAERMEWLLEKAVETGISELSFIQCEHSEKNRVNMARMEKIAIAALKQSGQPFLPLLHDLQPFSDCVSAIQSEYKLIAHCNNNFQRVPLNTYTGNLMPGRITVLIGPEGDFSEKEISLAESLGYKGISMGVSRLRTETAGLFAVVMLNGSVAAFPGQ